ncbi:MFS transporter [Rouxiella badensis]|jgi:OHS family lactose permease-like MFS transporter|uniref:MFS transporter n=1 Tax=Rouxiella badensis TaxID=1646377 RepID=A0A1X0WD75_9GAMM|nr:MFS transporter [Rouxiella badensis]ORJ24663.1 MFS transporter [Rouxiella badensis]
MYYIKNTNFWTFGLFFFFYFFIMGAYFPFFPIWLHDINHINQSDTGIIFASISFFSLVFQPLFGLLSDKLGLKKHLLWIITGMLVMFAPFFIYVFGPLLKTNILLGSIVGGVYLGFIYNGGAPAIEAYIEKVSRRSSFEFGRARMFGCVGWAICASVVGIMFTINSQFVFWLGSGCAVILAVLLLVAKPAVGATAKVANELGANSKPFSLRLAAELLKDKKLWFLGLYVVGVSCTYEVFDQQFANFFTSFFSSADEGTRVFGYITTMGELLNALVMFFAPLIVNRIGGKNALLLAGIIMSVRIIGSSFASTPVEVVVLKTLHMFEVPFLIVGCFKYITSVFEVRFSATIYLVCFCFFKQIAMIFMSVFAGDMYGKIGFHGTYLILGLIALAFTLLSVFTLSGRGPLQAFKPVARTVEKPVSNV